MVMEQAALQVVWIEGKLRVVTPDIGRRTSTCKNPECNKERSLPVKVGVGIAVSSTGKETRGPGNQKEKRI